MTMRRLPHILALLLVPSLVACGSGDKAPPPLEPAALAAVVEQPGVERERLARAVDELFADENAGETRALVLLSEGRIVAERYGEGYNRNSRLIGWSMAKTVTGVMIGQLVADGRLRLNETAPVPAWQRSGDPRGEITLRQLLQMRSGLRHTEAGSPVYDSDEVRMLFLDGRDDMAAYAEAQPLEAEPGRQFEYSSATTVILADIAARALTDNPDPAFRRKAVRDYLHTRLLDPVGMKSAMVEFDAAGTLIGSSLMHATARDWAQFGEFLRNGGAVKGAQLVPRGWIDFMKTSSPRNPAYGAQLWLNKPAGGDARGEDMLFPDRASRTAFACIGHLGQYVIVSPGQKLTLVRLGKTDGEHRARLRERLANILAVFPRD
ncbi:serine hydrolase domain-containing protein [Novosphingobium sp. JCM 18896]|uniref:serine hydrolase domain-containing protein n=1 Tax=Novosphingobium sp. JCM 18896 TaxID=2989731 RepID=UPI002221D6FE|nr:serine hydrolase [Novosphingobium sp. JCM 18896]MCW1429377.1 beta-lactamase family protein [Novosphingobium sp. JCM 18896]